MRKTFFVKVLFRDGITDQVPYREISRVYKIKACKYDYKIYHRNNDGLAMITIVDRDNVRDIRICND